MTLELHSQLHMCPKQTFPEDIAEYFTCRYILKVATKMICNDYENKKINLSCSYKLTWFLYILSINNYWLWLKNSDKMETQKVYNSSEERKGNVEERWDKNVMKKWPSFIFVPVAKYLDKKQLLRERIFLVLSFRLQFVIVKI